MKPELKNNVFDTALIFEGGGMRASYTSAVANTLLEQGIYFDNVYGLSAGSSLTANYVSRDMDRAKKSFVDIVTYPHFGGIGHLLMGFGYFNAEYIYEGMGLPDAVLPFDQETFNANPAKATIEAFQRDTGKSVYWTKKDLSTVEDLMKRVRASSTLPIVMPAPKVDGYYYNDGGLGEGAGFLLPKAKRDGFKRFFIVRTQPRGLRKPINDTSKLNKLVKLAESRYPHVRHALEIRAEAYNAQCDEIERLEDEGKAYVFYAENMQVTSATTDLSLLEKSYQDGWDQAHAELPKMLAFLEGHIEA